MFAPQSWQTERPSIGERIKFMLSNDLFSDVKFVVRKSDHAVESKQVIPAHKFVLSIGSPVFGAMFYGDLAETRDSIELPDCEYESLLELFRYLYSDEVNLSGSNVMGVLYLAKKYMVPSLADKCSEFLLDNLDASNVFNILPMAEKCNEKRLIDQCWQVIDNQSEEAVKSDEFTTIEHSLLEAVVSRGTLAINEIDLFKAVDLWATKTCEKQGIESNGKVKRIILGEKIIKEVRFLIMEEHEFASVVPDTKILTPVELKAIAMGFYDRKRSGIWVCDRFGSIYNGCKTYDGLKDYLLFEVDNDIMLHRLRFCGSENRKYSVKLKIGNLDWCPLDQCVCKTGTFVSKRLQCKNRNDYFGFEVKLGHSMALKKNERYLIKAEISGQPSWIGNFGSSVVKVAGVNFNFITSLKTGNGTCSTFGQFPQLVFSLCHHSSADVTKPWTSKNIL